MPKANRKSVAITYYLDVTSSWCFWSEPTWAELREQYEDTVDFGWKIAELDPNAYSTRAHQDWFYRRSGIVTRSLIKLSSAWMEPVGIGGHSIPNRVAHAAKSLGQANDKVRLALSEAALIEGRRIREMDVALEVAVAASGLGKAELQAVAISQETTNELAESRTEFDSLQIDQRPAFFLSSEIGDRAIFSGLIHYEPLAATIDAMLSDVSGYQSFVAHFGPPPSS
jgi:predicted DsbA family dithiol-disulfide isomerase